jgi:hypothetical protein
MERQRFWQDRQSWNYQFLTKIEDIPVKVSIRRDSYDFQSYARAYVWSDEGMEWRLAASLPYEDMDTLDLPAYVDDGRDWRYFEADEAALLEEVRWILTGKGG